MDVSPVSPILIGASRHQRKCLSYASTKFDRQNIRGVAHIKISPANLKLATWNVKGLTDEKLIALQQFMFRQDIDILCMQETHRQLSDYFISDAGFLVVLSGGPDNQREYAGVGFLISPQIRSAVHGFCQASNRMACLKIRVPGGKICVLSVYGPHAKRPFDERFGFFHDLLQFYQSISVHGPKIILRVFNSRLYTRFPGEDAIFGEYFFKNGCQRIKSDMNRFLLMELCNACSLQIENTFTDLPLEELVTYREPGIKSMATISATTFARLDLILVE